MPSHEFFQTTNEWIRLYYYDTSGRLVLFIFWKKLQTPKSHFEINWPLGHCVYFRRSQKSFESNSNKDTYAIYLHSMYIVHLFMCLLSVAKSLVEELWFLKLSVRAHFWLDFVQTNCCIAKSYVIQVFPSSLIWNPVYNFSSHFWI